MPIRILCPTCAKVLQVPDSAAGKMVRCGGCQTVITVPAQGSDAVQPAQPPPLPMAAAAAMPMAAPTPLPASAPVPSGAPLEALPVPAPPPLPANPPAYASPSYASPSYAPQASAQPAPRQRDAQNLPGIIVACVVGVLAVLAAVTGFMVGRSQSHRRFDPWDRDHKFQDEVRFRDRERWMVEKEIMMEKEMMEKELIEREIFERERQRFDKDRPIFDGRPPQFDKDIKEPFFPDKGPIFPDKFKENFPPPFKDKIDRIDKIEVRPPLIPDGKDGPIFDRRDLDRKDGKGFAP